MLLRVNKEEERHVMNGIALKHNFVKEFGPLTLYPLRPMYPAQSNVVIKSSLPFLCSPSETIPLLLVDIAETKQNP